jgi:hypothetical protein
MGLNICIKAVAVHSSTNQFFNTGAATSFPPSHHLQILSAGDALTNRCNPATQATQVCASVNGVRMPLFDLEYKTYRTVLVMSNISEEWSI